MTNPIIPTNKKNPVGQTARIQRCMRAYNKIISEVRKWLLGRVAQIPTREYEVQNSHIVNLKRYEYLIDITELQAIVAEIRRRMGDAAADEFQRQGLAAYREGTAQASANLARISEDYTRDITRVLSDVPYQRRAALVGGRVFEEMEGFRDQTARDLGRVLMQGLSDGRNPRQVGRELSARFEVSRSRALRIARTEMTGALRRGRWDEAQDARDRLGVHTKELWVSALMPTSRDSHVERHGEIYTVEEVRDFYAEGANQINCMCVQVSVLVDDDDNPIQAPVVERLQETRKEYQREHEDE